MRTLLVLGAADGAIGTFQAARRLGIRTIGVDGKADAPAAPLADTLLNVSTLAVPSIIAALDGLHIDGVVSPASDVNLPTQFALAQHFGLPHGLSAASVRASVDKGYFREVCDALGLPGPRWVQRPAAELIGLGLRPPIMVKPTDSSGSRGISRVDST